MQFQFENSTSDATLGDNQERLVRGLVEARKIRVDFEGNLEGDCGEAAAVTCNYSSATASMPPVPQAGSKSVRTMPFLTRRSRSGAKSRFTISRMTSRGVK